MCLNTEWVKMALIFDVFAHYAAYVWTDFILRKAIIWNKPNLLDFNYLRNNEVQII